MEWYSLFRQHILDRGAEYHQDGQVVNFKIAEDGIEASVEGTKTYHVDIVLDEEDVIYMTCDCPYAESGNNCKHMAAVLFRFEEELYSEDIEKEDLEEDLEEDFPWQKKFDARKKDVIELVDKIPEEEIRSLLVDFINADDSLRNKLQLKYSERLDAKQMLLLKSEINSIVESNSVRGFVDWYHASDFTADLKSFLEEKVKLLINRNYLEQAFELTNNVFRCIGNIDMDDSDGSSAYVADECYSCWKLILQKSNEKQKENMKRWFEEHQQGYVVDFMEEYLEEFLFSEFLSDELIWDKINELDEIISKRNGSHECGKIYSVHYGYENVILKRIEYMKKIGCTKEEVLEFRKKNRHFFIVREIEICEAFEKNDYDEAKKILLESKQIDDNYPEQVKKYSMQLIDLYEKTCDQQNYREELLYMLINCKQNDLTYFMKLKDEVSQLDKWEKLVEEILLNNRDVYFECKVLNEEKHYQQLADVITRSENLYLMDEYMKVLRNNSPQIVIEFYKKYVLKEVQRVSDRNGYRHLMEYLKKIKNCPGGNAVAVSIANQWKIEYKRRTAMMDELRKIGL